jgi:hypothetical protein
MPADAAGNTRWRDQSLIFKQFIARYCNYANGFARHSN